MPWESTAPAVIDALVAAFKTADGVAAADVVDGPVVSGSTRREAVMVGWDDDDEGVDSVEFDERTWAGFAADPLRESYTVNGAVRVVHGGKNIPAARARIFAVFAACAATVLADPSLGGLVMSAIPSPGRLRQRSGPKGAEALLPFTVRVDAHTT